MHSLVARSAFLVASILFAAGCGHHHGGGSVASSHSASHGSSGSSWFGSSGSHSSSHASSSSSAGGSSHSSSRAAANAVGAAAAEIVDLATRDGSGSGAGDESGRDRRGQLVPETECLHKLREWREMHPDAARVPPQLRCGPDGSWPVLVQVTSPI